MRISTTTILLAVSFHAGMCWADTASVEHVVCLSKLAQHGEPLNSRTWGENPSSEKTEKEIVRRLATLSKTSRCRSEKSKVMEALLACAPLQENAVRGAIETARDEISGRRTMRACMENLTATGIRTLSFTRSSREADLDEQKKQLVARLEKFDTALKNPTEKPLPGPLTWQFIEKTQTAFDMCKEICDPGLIGLVKRARDNFTLRTLNDSMRLLDDPPKTGDERGYPVQPGSGTVRGK